MRNNALEEDFQTLFKCISLVYSARQSGKLKRRWPLKRMVIVAPEKVCTSLKNVEELLLELANVKTVEYSHAASEYTSQEGWVSASEDNMQVFLDIRRDEGLLGEGLMRDLARRVQSLRKELGYVPTDVLEAVYIAELEDESIRLLKPYLTEMKELVRAKNVHLQGNREEVEVEWHEYQLDDKKVYIAIPQQEASR
jgi:isoleucyl-tRNA synthetase